MPPIPKWKETSNPLTCESSRALVSIWRFPPRVSESISSHPSIASSKLHELEEMVSLFDLIDNSCHRLRIPGPGESVEGFSFREEVESREKSVTQKGTESSRVLSFVRLPSEQRWPESCFASGHRKEG